MDLRYAHGFFEVAKTLHFAKAANNMMIAPSALTRQIRLFEDSIGENLLIRTNRKVILTPKGQEVLRWLTPLLAKEKHPQLTLRIGGLIGVIDNFFWPTGQKIISNKHTNLIINECTSGPAIEKLITGELDIAFVNDKVKNDLIKYIPLGKEELVLISKRKIKVTEIKNFPWIFCGKGWKLRSLAEKETSVQIQVSSLGKILDLVELGLGIGVVPLSERLKTRNFFISGLPIENRNIYIATLKYDRMPAHIDEVIRDVVGK